ncbi:hypothetical protein KIS4809_3029 [Bacillus sp. ZZV12-4809]|nr:hypothetical protein KIS4809_3029 [Bacillus sp. ZZV12-4809]
MSIILAIIVLFGLIIFRNQVMEDEQNSVTALYTACISNIPFCWISVL